MSRFARTVSVAAFLGILGFQSTAGAGVPTKVVYSVTHILPTLGGHYLQPNSMTNDGRIVGASTFKGDKRQGAFIWQKGHIKGLPTLGGPQSWADSINASGAILGIADTSTTIAPEPIFNTASGFCWLMPPGQPTVACHAVLWKGGKAIDLGTLGGAQSAAVGNGLNDKGQAVGVADTNTVDPSSKTRAPEFHAFLGNHPPRR